MTAYSKWGITALSHGDHSHTIDTEIPAPPGFFRIDCEQCEAWLFHQGEADQIEVTPGNPLKGVPPKLRKVHRNEPGWATTMAACPPTDQEKERLEDNGPDQRGRYNVEALERLAASRDVGLPAELVYLTENRLPSGTF